MRNGAPELTKSLNEGFQYRFLGVLEDKKQENYIVLENGEKEYLKRVSVIWSSHLSDHNKVLATNQFALPAMTYQPRSEALSSPERKTLVGSGHVRPRF